MANITKFTDKRAEMVLAALREKPTFLYAASKAGITRETLYKWRRANPEFSEACMAARDEGMESLEDALIERGMETDTTAAIFLLKGWRANRYRERVEHTGENGSPLTVVITVRSDGPV